MRGSLSQSINDQVDLEASGTVGGLDWEFHFVNTWDKHEPPNWLNLGDAERAAVALTDMVAEIKRFAGRAE